MSSTFATLNVIITFSSEAIFGIVESQFPVGGDRYGREVCVPAYNVCSLLSIVWSTSICRRASLEWGGYWMETRRIDCNDDVLDWQTQSPRLLSSVCMCSVCVCVCVCDAINGSRRLC